MELGKNIQSATISAKVIRGDGTVEDLGVISSSENEETGEPKDEADEDDEQGRLSG